MTLEIKQVNDEFSVSGQIDLADLQLLALSRSRRAPS